MRVTLQGVTKEYGGQRVLEGVTGEIDPGHLVALVGSNGAGKTTLFRCLATICVPSSGRVLLDGEVLERARVDLRKRLFFLADFPFLYWHASPVQHVAMVARLYDRLDVDPDVVFGLLEQLDLLGCARTPIGRLSRGQAYKTALAALFTVAPDLVILDEPFASGMDPHGIGVLKGWIRGALQRGTTVLYSTQILEVARAFSDRVAVLHRGKLRAFDSVGALESGSSAAGLEGILEELREEAP
jgi:ABC-type multidrug transport system ATPase subunit